MFLTFLWRSLVKRLEGVKEKQQQKVASLVPNITRVGTVDIVLVKHASMHLSLSHHMAQSAHCCAAKGKPVFFSSHDTQMSPLSRPASLLQP